MAKWVNISDGTEPGVPAYTGSGYAGTEGDPFSFADWDGYINANPGETYYVKGWKNQTAASFTHGVAFTAQGWDTPANGPWRLRINQIGGPSDISCASGIFKNCVLEANQGGAVLCGGLDDAAIMLPTTTVIIQTGTGLSFTRVLIWHGTDIPISPTVGTVLFDLCAMEYQGWTTPWAINMQNAGNTVTVSNCATDEANFASLIGGSGTAIDGGGNIYNQSFGVFPAWDEVDLTAYDLIPGYGVGAPGGWAVVPPPTSDFSGTPLSGFAPLTVRYTELATYTGTPTWFWTFGDGYTSTEQYPVHTYYGTGSYTITLTVTDAGGTDTETKGQYVAAAPPSPRLKTYDLAPPDDQELLTKMISRGTSRQNFIRRGVRYYIKAGETSVTNSGFRRPQGPSVICD